MPEPTTAVAGDPAPALRLPVLPPRVSPPRGESLVVTVGPVGVPTAGTLPAEPFGTAVPSAAPAVTGHALVGLAANDNRRLLGALIDLIVSLAMAVAMILVVAMAASDGPISFGAFVAIALGFWAADVALYAVPLSRAGASIGNLLTGVRVVDASTGGRVPLGRAVARYAGRRIGFVTLRFVMLFESPVPSLRGRRPTRSFADRCARSLVVRAA